MPLVARVSIALALLVVTGFCAFGFLATYEPPGSPVLRLVYGIGAVAFAAAAGWLALRRGRA